MKIHHSWSGKYFIHFIVNLFYQGWPLGFYTDIHAQPICFVHFQTESHYIAKLSLLDSDLESSLLASQNTRIRNIWSEIYDPDTCQSLFKQWNSSRAQSWFEPTSVTSSADHINQWYWLELELAELQFICCLCDMHTRLSDEMPDLCVYHCFTQCWMILPLFDLGVWV